MDCLMVMPSGVVLALLAMLPRLEAEESRAAVDRAAMAAGTMPEDARRATEHAWAEAANPEPVARKVTPDALAAHGIPVRLHKRTKAAG